MPTQKLYTFAIHTSQRCNQKLQKSMSFSNALTAKTDWKNKAHGHNNVYKSLGG